MDLATAPGAARAFRRLLLLSFARFDYDAHYGGDGIVPLLTRENPLLRIDLEAIRRFDECALDALSDAVGKGDYDRPDADDRLYGTLPWLPETTAPTVRAWAGRLANENHFAVEDAAVAALAPRQATVGRLIPEGTSFVRARIGYRRHFPNDWDPRARRVYVPYQESDIGAPPAPWAVAQRTSRAGVAYLYLASDVPTAVAEVRPHPGDVVSLGTFRARRPLRLADFAALDYLAGSATDQLVDDYVFLSSIQLELNTPVVPAERDRYLVGQVVGGAVRRLGFDGLAYRSSVAAGTNVAVFDPAACAYVADSGTVVHVERVDYVVTPGRTCTDPAVYDDSKYRPAL